MNRSILGSGRTAAVVITGLGCVLVAVGLGGPPGGRPLPASQSGPGSPASHASPGGPDGPELRVPASAAGWVSVEAAGQQDGRLRAGDTGGGAVTYLKFEVPVSPALGGPGPRLRLTGADRPLPQLVELVAVPDTSWDPATLHWQSAPVLGRVVQSVRPAQDGTVTFDLSDAVGPESRPGAYAFAVTVPPDRGYAVFVGSDGSPAEPAMWLPRGHDAAIPSGPPAEAFPAPGSSPAPGASGPPGSSPAPGWPAPPGSSPAPAPVQPSVPIGTSIPSLPPSHPPAPPTGPPECTVEDLLVPTCGVLWGTAPAGHTGSPRTAALAEFETETGRRQDIYHAYHRAQTLFPTEQERAIAAEGRLLFLNWKPLRWSWAQIAAGNPAIDSYLDKLADHINRTFPEPFFFTIHHEPENDVRSAPGSGWQARDYAAMFRYVVERLRSRGVDNLVTVVAYMAYVPWNATRWFPDLYPGDDVVDWVAWDTYAYSDPGYGHGDFAEMLNRRSSRYPNWPGFYNWATDQFPDKPFMLAEWGVWHSRRNPGHMATFYDSVARQTPLFPRLKALVYFDTPGDQRSRDSRPTATQAGLAAFQRLGGYPYFQVRLPVTDAGR